jgi:hypothetical protein
MDKKIENKVKAYLLKQWLMIDCLTEEVNSLKEQNKRLLTALENLEMFEKLKK